MKLKFCFFILRHVQIAFVLLRSHCKICRQIVNTLQCVKHDGSCRGVTSHILQSAWGVKDVSFFSMRVSRRKTATLAELQLCLLCSFLKLLACSFVWGQFNNGSGSFISNLEESVMNGLQDSAIDSTECKKLFQWKVQTLKVRVKLSSMIR